MLPCTLDCGGTRTGLNLHRVVDSNGFVIEPDVCD